MHMFTHTAYVWNSAISAHPYGTTLTVTKIILRWNNSRCIGRLHDDLLPLFSGNDQPLHAGGSQSFFHFSHCSLDACCLLLQLLPCVKIINFPGSNSVSLTWPMKVFGSTNMHKQTI